MAKGKKMVGLNFLYGLPASGKTHFANTNWPNILYQNHDNPLYIDVDYLSKYHQVIGLVRQIASFINNIAKPINSVVIDGLFTTNQQIMDICDALDHDRFEFVCHLYWWREDRETCLYNDIGRRIQNSTNSILNLPFEEPDIQILGKYFKESKINVRKVQRKSKFQVWIAENDFSGNGLLKSSRWSTGGSWKNCWGNSGTVDADDTPLSFEEFDKLLEKICPSISFLLYKKIYAECVSIVDYGESDYYGGYRNFQQFQCDLKKLYGLLIRNQLIENTEF